MSDQPDPGARPGDLAARPMEQEVTGTYNCPVCGWNVPHSEHATDMIARLSQEAEKFKRLYEFEATMRSLADRPGHQAHIAEVETQLAEAQATITALPWRCFHCDEVFTDEAEAREHFGSRRFADTAACQLTAADVKELRALEHTNERLRCLNEELENDARLWHEAEADRVRRIGNVQWWQELDSREGEKLALQATITALTQENQKLREDLQEARDLYDANHG